MVRRPEIDGLRALAVLSVVLFHSGLDGFEGGFVGVDVFFVISGYLITTVIMRDLEKGSFSLQFFFRAPDKADLAGVVPRDGRVLGARLAVAAPRGMEGFYAKPARRFRLRLESAFHARDRVLR